MNEDLNKVLNRITEEENLAKEFCQLDDMDEMYKYCFELGEGYTEEEFDEGISELISALHLEGETTELSEKDLDRIAGGLNMKGMVSKTAAVVLSALTMGGVMSSSAKAVDVSQGTGTTQSFFTRVKSKISDNFPKTKQAWYDLWKNHKGKIIGVTIAATALAGSIAIAKHRKTVAERQRQRDAEAVAQRQIDAAAATRFQRAAAIEAAAQRQRDAAAAEKHQIDAEAEERRQRDAAAEEQRQREAEERRQRTSAALDKRLRGSSSDDDDDAEYFDAEESFDPSILQAEELKKREQEEAAEKRRRIFAAAEKRGREQEEIRRREQEEARRREQEESRRREQEEARRREQEEAHRREQEEADAKALKVLGQMSAEQEVARLILEEQERKDLAVVLYNPEEAELRKQQAERLKIQHQTEEREKKEKLQQLRKDVPVQAAKQAVITATQRERKATEKEEARRQSIEEAATAAHKKAERMAQAEARREEEEKRQRPGKIRAELANLKSRVSALEIERGSIQSSIKAQERVKSSSVDRSGQVKQKALTELRAQKRAKEDEARQLAEKIVGLKSELEALKNNS